MNQEDLQTIEDLKNTAIKLNQVSDELNKVIASVNKDLSNLNLGIEAWVEFPLSKGTRLGYTRVTVNNENTWQLAVKRGEDYAMALIKAPRAVRAEGMSVLLPLLKELRNRADKLSQSIADQIPAGVA